MKPLCTLVLLLASAATLAAQTVPPALMVQQDGRSVPLGLAKLRTEVRIFGTVAETTTTLTFANPMARPMEGDLYFPLPEGATISGYALDINGAMIDGVAVEKHEARRVYEEVVRHGIDPGLVQWTQGNNFQTRVFPIPAHGTRTIRVDYVSELIGGREAPAYHLPLKFKNKIPEFSLRVEVVKSAAPPKVTKGELTNFAFEKWHDSFVAETKQQDWSPVEDLVVALPKTEGPQVLVETADDGQTYFAFQDYPVAPATESPVTTAKRAVIFWDASGSRTGDHQREIILLQNYLTKLLASDQSKIAVDLVLLRNTLSKPVRIDFSKADHAALAAALEQVQYDGGTQLGAIGPLSGLEKPDLYLLFTDGISDFGSETPARLDAPLFIFSADATANHALLHSLAMTNGGQYFNLANWKDADVLAQAGRSAWSFLSASTQQRSAKDLYPQLPQPLGGRSTLVGKLTSEVMTVNVTYGVPGGRSEQRTFTAGCDHAVKGTLLRRLWAQKKLAHLMIHQKENEKEIAALGKQYGLVTPYTSLLVLDSLEQYVQYEIAPPKSLAAMREEYMRRVDTLEHQRQREKADKLAEVLQMWQERVKWWNAEFKYAKDFKYRGEQEGQGNGVVVLSADAALAPAAPAPRADRPMAESRMRVPPATPPVAAPAISAPAADAAPAGAAPRPDPGATPTARLAQAESRAANAALPQPAGAAQPASTPSLRAERMVTETLAFHDRRQAEAKGDDAGGQSGGQSHVPEPGIVIKPWQPDMAYLKELQAAKGKADQWAVYMKNRAQNSASPGFFLDCADFFRASGDNALALQVLSNIAELQLEEAALLRVLGHRLLQIGQIDLAVQTFEQVLELRPEEPQSYRDLALALASRAEETRKALENAGQTPKSPNNVMHPKVTLFNGTQTFVTEMPNAEAVRADYTRAIDLLTQVTMRRWDGRFPQIEVIALEELNRIIPRAKAVGVSVIPLDPKLIQLLDFDVRIVMTWQADNTDIDLWVTEPSGEKAFYGHNRTTIGGLVSCDFTQGYGPEEYMVHRAVHGMYKIDANYFGSRATRLLGPVTVQVDVFTNYGRPNEQRKSLTLRLKEAQETVRIGEIEF